MSATTVVADRGSGGEGAEALGRLAALPGVHRLHRVAAAHVPSRHRRSHPRPHLPRLSRDAVRGVRPPGRSGARRTRSRRTTASTSASSKARFRRRTAGSTARSAGARRSTSSNDVGVEGRRGHRHRLVRVVGRHSVGGSESDRRDRRADDPEGQAGRHAARAARRIPTTSSAWCCSTRRSARCRSSTSSAGRCSPTAARFTSTARAARTSTPAASRTQFGDEGHRQGYCLYKLGCKGPMTHANCSTLAFGEVVDCWPIGIGHPCVGCTEQAVAFRIPMHDDGADRAADPARHLRRRSTRSRDASVRPRPRSPASSAARCSAPATSRRGRSTRPTRTPASGDATDVKRGCSVGITRRTAFKVALAGAAAAVARPVTAARRRGGAGRRGRPALRHHEVHRLQGLRGRVPRGERPRARHALRPAASTTRRSISTKRPRPSSSCTTTATHRSFMKAQCMHCVDPACANACMLGAFKKREFGIVTYDVELLHRLPLLRSGLPVRRAEVRVVEGGAEDGEVRAVQPPARARESSRRARKSARGRRSSSASARTCCARRSARLAANPGRLRPEGLRRDRRRRHAVPLPLARAVRASSACRRSASESTPTLQRTIQHSIYKGFAAPIALYGVLGAVMLRNRQEGRDARHERARAGAARRRPHPHEAVPRARGALRASARS